MPRRQHPLFEAQEVRRQKILDGAPFDIKSEMRRDEALIRSLRLKIAKAEAAGAPAPLIAELQRQEREIEARREKRLEIVEYMASESALIDAFREPRDKRKKRKQDKRHLVTNPEVPTQSPAKRQAKADNATAVESSGANQPHDTHTEAGGGIKSMHSSSNARRLPSRHESFGSTSGGMPATNNRGNFNCGRPERERRRISRISLAY
jgi:hypothetical protein